MTIEIKLKLDHSGDDVYMEKHDMHMMLTASDAYLCIDAIISYVKGLTDPTDEIMNMSNSDLRKKINYDINNIIYEEYEIFPEKYLY